MPRIKILSGIRSGEVFDLSGERVSFGRNRGSTVRILDSWISWDHARLVRQGETWWLEDQGSANGTYVNEAAITRAALNDQDVFALGKTQVRFLASDGAPAAGAERVAPPPPLPAAPPEPEVPGPDALGPGHTRRLPRLPSEERPAVPAGRDPAPRPAVRSTPFSRGRQGSAAEAASPPPKAEVAEAPPAVPGPQGEAGAAAGRAAPFSRGRRTTWLGTVVDESQAAGTGAAPGAQEVATPRGRSAGAPKGRITITRGPRPARPSGEVPAAAAPAARDAPPPDAPAPAGGRTLRNHPLLRGRKSRTGEVALPAGLPRAEAPPPLVAPTAELAVPVETGELGALQGERPAAPPPERPGPSPRVRPQVPTRPAPQAPRNTRELEAVIEDAVLSGESVSIALPPPRPAAPRAEVEPPVRPPPPSAPAVPDRQRELLDRAQDLERRHGAAEVEASRLRGRVAELEARLRDEADTAERRAEASSAQAARRDGELRAERDEARLEADGLRARLDELARRRDEEEAKGGRLVQEAVGLQREVDSSRQRVEELADLRMEDARALDALKLDHAERERRLHDEVASLKAEVVRLGTEVEEGDARIFDLNVEAERLRQVEGLHQRVSEQMDATVGERVRERLREIRDIHAGQAEENERLRSEVAALEERLAALKKDKETLGVAARGLERRLSEVQSAHDEAVAGREKLLRAHNRKLGELQGELQALASERDELARRAFDLENRGREHLLRIGELDRRAEQSESQRLALEVMAATARPGAVEPEALRQKRAQLEASLSAKEDRIAASLERTAQLRSRREAIARELEATDGSVRDPAARATRRGELEAERDEVETGLTVEEPRLSSLRDDRERLAAALAALGAGEAAQDLQRELERVRQEGRARVAALEDEVAALESARDHALRERESAREDTARDYERRLARADGIARELRRQVEELAGGAAPQAAPAATGGPAPTPASGGPPAVLGRLAAALAEGLNSPVRAVDEAMRTVADGVGDLGILLDAYGALPLEGLPDRDRRRIEGLRRDLALEVMLDGLANAVETGRREAGRTREAVALLRGFLRLEKERRGRSDASELGRTVAAVASMAAGGRATLRTSFAEAAEAPLWPGVLGQALLELVLDALEGAGEGEEVWLTTTAGGNFVRLEVRGSWGGAAEVVPPPAVEEAARRHGGEVTVTASPGRGATVAIKLPRA